jgi:transmembrane sensor
MSQPDEQRREEAAAWFAAQRRGAMALDERARFDAWRADPLNQTALDRMHQLWGEAAAIKALDTPLRLPRDRRFAIAAGIAAVLMLFVLAGVGFMALRPSEAAASIETAVGEQKTQSLPDGSLVAVNVASRLSYDMGGEQRLVSLEEGEAAFVVQSDPGRPFLVRAGDYAIRATGAAFNVRQRGGVVEIGVSDGSVAVAARRGAPAGRMLRVLRSGQALRLPASAATAAEAPAPSPIPVTQVAEWRMRVVTYEDVSVGEVIEDFNRFFVRPVRSADPELARRRVTIRLQVEDRERALDTLADLLGADIRPAQREDVLAPSAP